MINAWINKNDVFNILSECECINEYIERKGLILKINALQEHKRPVKPKKPIPERINDVSIIKSNIFNYQINVKIGYQKSYFDEWLDSENAIITENGCSRVASTREGLRWTESDEKDFKEKYNINNVKTDIVPINYILSVLGISYRTLIRWKKKGIIKKYTEHNIIDFYNLSEIYENIKYLNKDI